MIYGDDNIHAALEKVAKAKSILSKAEDLTGLPRSVLVALGAGTVGSAGTAAISKRKTGKWKLHKALERPRNKKALNKSASIKRLTRLTAALRKNPDDQALFEAVRRAEKKVARRGQKPGSVDTNLSVMDTKPVRQGLAAKIELAGPLAKRQGVIKIKRTGKTDRWGKRERDVVVNKRKAWELERGTDARSRRVTIAADRALEAAKTPRVRKMEQMATRGWGHPANPKAVRDAAMKGKPGWAARDFGSPRIGRLPKPSVG